MLKSFFKGLCCIVIMLLSSSLVSAQNKIVVRGKVTAANTGEALPGVNILVEGTTHGATTDTTGHYFLEVSSAHDTLRFSFIGYKTRHIPIKGRETLNVKLYQTAVSSSKGMMVVGLGRQKKESVTSAISSISTKELTKSPQPNLKASLAGKLPGLTSIQTSGKPGNDNTQLFLRGRSTINGQKPLILVDGQEQQNINYIDPNAVSSVTILKDASATAVYGTRGANGVVLITTKRGHSGTPTIHLSADYGLSNFTRHPHVVNNSYEWAKLKNQAAKNDGTPPPFSQYDLKQYKKRKDTPLYPETHWRDEIIRDYAPQQHYNLNFSGGAGGGNVRYFVNAGYLHQGGQWKTHQNEYDVQSSFKRYNFRSNIDADLTSSTQAVLNLSGELGKVHSPGTSTLHLLADISSMNPTIYGPLGPDGQVLASPSMSQHAAYGDLNKSGYHQNTRSNFTSTFAIKQDFSAVVEGLSAKLSASFNGHSVHALDASQPYESYKVIPSPSDSSKAVYEKFKGDVAPLSLSTNTTFRSRSNFQAFINYDHTFGGKHHVTGLLYGQKRKTIKPGNTIPFNLIGTSTRLTYGYNNKYFFQFNAGYNGSEQFAPGNRFGFFPAFSGGWLISNEKFLQDNSTITHLKIRGSYGWVGSDQLGGRRFLYLDNIHQGGNAYSGSLGGSINASLIGNPNLQWEVNHKANIGLELGLFNQLNLNIDVFKQHRTNVLISGANTAPALNGLPLGALPPTNTGVIDNKGYEIVLKYNKIFNADFTLQAQINYDYAKNNIVDVGENKRRGNYAYPYRQEGHSIGQQYGYVTNGYFNNKKEIENYASYEFGAKPRPGDFKYKDLNGDGIINRKDQAPIGYGRVPQHNFGASVSFSYKRFDFSILFQGTSNVSHDARTNSFAVYEKQNFFSWHKHAWTAERAQAGKSISYPALSLASNSSSNTSNDFFIEDTGYIRLKNFDIGYTLPTRWTDSFSSKKVRFYINGNNLFTWDHLNFEGYDPELGNGLTYPVLRTISLGVDLNF